ncbi:MAG: hypothetical protein M3619_02925 [Myxococcota bacterium]|nr:hypothetical protein [Myxococcota bacterium]
MVLCAACQASIGGAGDDEPGTPDAGTPVDATTITTDAPTANACPNMRRVYLNFDGVALTDAAASDATLNRASWMQIANGTAPPFRQGDANRAQVIADITAGIKAQLAAFPIEVVTQRPAGGLYVMIVFGGTNTQVGSRFGGAVNELDCDDSEKSDVAWISDGVGSVQRNVNFAMGAIGFGLGLTATTAPTGCMCGWDNDAVCDNTVPCQLSASIERDPATRQPCPNVTTQNEVAAFAQKFCE